MGEGGGGGGREKESGFYPVKSFLARGSEGGGGGGMGMSPPTNALS